MGRRGHCAEDYYRGPTSGAGKGGVGNGAIPRGTSVPLISVMTLFTVLSCKGCSAGTNWHRVVSENATIHKIQVPQKALPCRLRVARPDGSFSSRRFRA